MVDINEKKEKIKGFPILLKSILIPLNENNKFREKFKNANAKILLNVPNLSHAALIVIDHGFINVKSISNEPRANIKRKKVGWNVFLEIESHVFLSLATTRISILGIAKLWLNRKIKIQGIRKILLLLRMLNFFTEY